MVRNAKTLESSVLLDQKNSSILEVKHRLNDVVAICKQLERYLIEPRESSGVGHKIQASATLLQAASSALVSAVPQEHSHYQQVKNQAQAVENSSTMLWWLGAALATAVVVATAVLAITSMPAKILAGGLASLASVVVSKKKECILM